MPPPDNLSALRDIEHAAALVLRWAALFEDSDIPEDEMLESAVYRQLSVVGEAARRLDRSFQDAHPEVDWRSWIDFRNVLVHAYDSIDIDRVWDVVRQELEPLRRHAERFIAEALALLEGGETAEPPAQDE